MHHFRNPATEIDDLRPPTSDLPPSSLSSFNSTNPSLRRFSYPLPSSSSHPALFYLSVQQLPHFYIFFPATTATKSSWNRFEFVDHSTVFTFHLTVCPGATGAGRKKSTNSAIRRSVFSFSGQQHPYFSIFFPATTVTKSYWTRFGFIDHSTFFTLDLTVWPGATGVDRKKSTNSAVRSSVFSLSGQQLPHFSIFFRQPRQRTPLDSVWVCRSVHGIHFSPHGGARSDRCWSEKIHELYLLEGRRAIEEAGNSPLLVMTVILSLLR